MIPATNCGINNSMKKFTLFILILTIFTSVSFAPLLSYAQSSPTYYASGYDSSGNPTQINGSITLTPDSNVVGGDTYIGSDKNVYQYNANTGLAGIDQTASLANGGTGIPNPGPNSQTNTTAGGSASNAVTGAGTSALSCATGAIVAQMAQAIVSSITGTAVGIGALVASKVLAVPITNTTLELNSGTSAGSNSLDTKAHTANGLTIGGLNFNFLPSWDAIAFCIGNALITYIANSTTNWINSGFNGNPAFVSNPTQFFTDIVNGQANSFVSSLPQQLASQAAGGFASGFATPITQSLISNFNSTLGVQTKFTQGNYTSNPAGFYSGNPSTFGLGGLQGVAMGAGNSFVNTAYLAGNAMALQSNNAVIQAQNLLNQGNGYNPVTVTPTNPNGTQGTPIITVPGSDIQKAGQDSRNLANLRLVAAQKFDQVISALVNELIKVALNKLLTVGSK
jgi:hypothetical protein